MLSYILATVMQLSIPTTRLDRIAMGLSGLCLVHCVATAVLLALLASAGGLLGSPIIHEVGLNNGITRLEKIWVGRPQLHPISD